MLNKQNIKDIYPLSPMQEGMLFHSLIDGESIAYFEQSSYTINGKLDTIIFQKSIDLLIERHEILRTVFVHKNVSKPFQVVLKNVDFKIVEKDLVHLSEKEQDIAFDNLKQADFDKPFKMDKDVLLRVSLIKISSQKHKVIWSHHHILMDGWCMGVLIGEFLHIYKNLLNGKTPSLNPPVPYVNYIKWLEKQDKNNSKAYWKKYLTDVTERNSLPSFSKKEKASYEKCILKFTLPKQLTEGIKALGATHGITPNIIFQTTWGILLQRYNYSEQGVFGAVVSGRPPEIPGVSSIIGLFINTIPVKVTTSSSGNFVDLVKQVQRDASEKLAHEHLSLADIAEESPLKKDIIDHILVYENFPVSMDIENLDANEYGFTISDIDTFEQTNYDLNVIFFPKGNDLHIKYDFNTLVYPEDVIKEVHQHYCHLLEQAIQNKSLSEISLLDEKAKNEQLARSVENPFDKPDVTVLNFFHEQVKSQPNATAVNFEGKNLSYQELEVSANRLASVLINEYAINKGEIVALLADRSEKLIVSILAILKAGAAYVPIDTANPTDRIAYMLEDSGAKLLITDRNEQFSVPVFDISSIYALSESPLLNNRASLSDLAYIIYTSGSTGKPKGCKLTHANLLSYLNWVNEYYFTNSAAAGHSCLFTSLSFDLTITSIFTPLIRGKQLTIYPQNWDIKELLKAVFASDSPTDFVKITPAHATLLPHLGIDKTSVKAVLLGGEELKKEHVVNLKQLHPDITVFNEYGPTETTVGCSAKKITSAEEVITIGYPSSNATILIMDRHLNPLPSGAIGEICVLGSGVGLGYHNKPELTAEKFITYDGKKGYRTGDLGYKLPNGEIQCLGRMDGQVKLRGYRIETGEIEQQLLNTGKISQCFVKVTAEMLCAYVVSDTPIQKSTMVGLLGGFLPEYMLPDTYIQLEEIPLTINGKVDQKALPNPMEQTAVFVAPKSETEQKLAAIWQQVLGVERVGRTDHFFELGGHSLKTTILASQILKSLEKEVRLKQIFEHPVLKELATLIDRDDIAEGIPLEVIPSQEHYDLSYSQKQIWIVQQIDANSVAYIIPATRKLRGKLDKEAFEQAFHTLIQRHDVLRANFKAAAGTPKMKIHPTSSFKLVFTDHSNAPEKEKQIRDLDYQNATTSFDLANDCLLRATLVKTDDDEHVLFFAMHHIVSDGWSMDLIVAEIAQLYNAYVKGNENPLTLLNFQYKDYLAWEEKMLSGKRLEEQKEFWKNHFSQGIKAIGLPYDKPKIEQTFNGKTLLFHFSDDQKMAIAQQAKTAGVTLNVYLLAIYNVFLAKISQQNDITVRSITTGRNHADLQKIIGYFVRVFGVNNQVNGEQPFLTFLKSVNERFISAMDNDLYPYEMVMQDFNAGKTNDTSINVDYVYQNVSTANIAQGIEMNDISIEPMSIESLVARNDFLLTVNEENHQIDFSFTYNTDLFSDEKADLFVTQFKHLLSEIVTNPAQEIAHYQLNKGTENTLFEYLELDKTAFEAVYPLTTTQRDIYLECSINPEGTAQQLASFVIDEKPLDKKTWFKTIEGITQEQPALRIDIIAKSNTAYQAIRTNQTPVIKELDISNEQLSGEQLHERLLEIAHKTNQLEAPFCEHFWVEIGNGKVARIIAGHHIVFDGVSGQQFFENASKRYEQLCRAENIELKIDTAFVDYIPQHHRLFDRESTAKYWQEKLAQVTPLEPMHLEVGAPQMVTEKCVVSSEHIMQVENYCKTLNISPALYFKGLFIYLVKNYCNAQEDFFIRELAGGRSADNSTTMGCFFHSLPVVIEQKIFKQPLEDFFNSLKQQKKQLGGKQNISVFLQNQLVGENKIHFFYNYSPYFTIDTPQGKQLLYENETTGDHDVEFKIEIQPNNVVFRLNYNARLFSSQQFTERLIALSEQVLNGASELTNVSILLPQEKQELARPSTEVDFPSEKTLHQLFEEQVEQTPQKVAVRFGEKTLTYKELNEKSNQFANYLIELGIQKEEVVPILVERSTEMVIGLLAIIKTGGAYLPIDPTLPQDRIDYMLSDSRANYLLTLANMDSIPFSGKIIHLDDSSCYQGADTNPETTTRPDNLVYVIYTSGSTGKPKGTMLEHAGVVNRIHWMKNKYDFNTADVVIQKTTYSFDVSVWEFFMTLCYGAELVLCEKEVIYDADRLIDFIERYQITTLHFVPSMFNVFLSRINDSNKERLKSIRQIFTSGEALSLEAVKKQHRFLDAKLHNLYGPTEASVDVTYFETSAEDTEVPIGKAIDNIQLYILDPQLNSLPHGIPGELHIAGVGVARGYLNREELTDEKFIPNPYGEGKLYKTGDLTKWREDGNILYLGRIDHQVKIRGYRIELGEIEEKIRTIAGVQDAAVITKSVNDELEICSYFVTDQGITSEEIQAELKVILPDYMIPSYVMEIEEIPLSPNGKLDRRALPEPEIVTTQSGTLPQDETSQSLAKIWNEILGVDTVFLESDFFQLGGHSLRASLLVARIEKSFELKIPLAAIFKNRTLTAQVSLIKSSDKTKVLNIEKAPQQAHYPLSAAQKRLFFLEKMEGVGTSYHLPAVFEVKGDLDLIRLEEALNKLIQRHATLRTSFHLKEHEPIQFIHEKGVFNLEKIKQSNGIETAVTDFIRPFNLEQPTQLRIGIISKNKQHHYLLFDMHHIISDGSSVGILVRELIALYHNESLPELYIQYYDFAHFQQSDNYKKGLAEQAEYWLSIFSDEVPLLELPTDFNRPAQQTFDGALHCFSLNQSTTEKLHQLASTHDATLFMVMLGLYNVLLAKYSGQQDIVVGTPVAGRTHADLQQQIGMFVNTLPLRNQPNHATSFTDFLAEVKTNALHAFDHQDYPFEKVIEQLNIPRRVNRNPLFDTMFVLQNTEKEAIEIEGLSFSPVDFENKTSKFDLTLHASEIEDGIYLGFEYNTNLFKSDTITKMAAHFCQLVEAICAQPEKPLAEIDWIGSEERHRLIKTFNQSEITYPNLTALALFEEQVKANPNAIALELDELKLTFTELNAQANKLANYLLNKGLKKEEITAIFLDRNEKVIVSILGILKAGGAYLPIDKTLPENRVQYMLADSDAKFVLTDEQLNISDLNCELIDISTTWKTIESCATDEPKISVGPKQLAYVIYTSGSTGQPKGCKIAHQNLFNYIRFAIDTYFSNGNGSLGLYTSLSFDLTITSIFGSLCNGKPLFIYSETEVPDILTHTFSPSTTIDAVKITPAHISLLQHLPIQETNIEVAIVGGEAVTTKHISILKQLNPNIRIFNEYGPTETTVGCIVKELATDTEKVLIGKPIANTQVYILNEQQQLLPQGVFGEIWIGGAGVGRGYLNKQDLTASRFVTNPFGEGLVYKTGDIGRWTATGEVDYLGRKDEQVKIKGYRIELGEIEGQLQQLPTIKEAVVIDVLDNTGEKQLVAYYTGSASTSEIKFALSEQLPSYMIPSFFVELDAIPLTINGKVDRRLLPQPEKQSASENYQAPESNIEQLLADIWKQVLRVERVSKSDDFFHLGGDSIKAIQVSSRLRNKGYSIKIKDIFENSRLKDLALKAEKTEFIANQNEVTGFAPFTAIQKTFLADENIDHNYYNQSVMLFNKDGFDKKIVAEAFKQLWKHHDALRIHVKDNQLLNLAVNDVEFKIANYTGLNATEIESKANEIQRSFELQKAPLMRVALFPTNEGDHLLIIIHHLIVDGISWRILLEDFNAIYDNLKAGKSIELPQKSTAFLTWADAVNNLANSDEFIRNQGYWFELSKQQMHPIFEARNNENTIVSKKIAFDEIFTKKLLKQVNPTFGTDVNDILLSALSLALADLSSEQDFLIALEGHGREDILPQLDVARTVGWFTSMFPVLLNKSESDLTRHIIETKERLRKIPQKGIGYGILKYVTDATKKADFSEQIHPQVLFNFLGDFDESIASDNFTLSSLSNGDNTSSKSNLYPLTLNGLIAHQKLQFDIDFNTSYLSEEQHEQFMKLFEQHLTAVVDCCLNQGNPVKTPSDYNLTDISYDELQKITESYNSEIEKIYPLSPMQQGMLFHNLMDGEDEAYFEQTVLSVSGNLNIDLFEKAFNTIIARHEILRANMVYSQLKRPHQVILKEKFARIHHDDLRALKSEEQENFIADYLVKEKKKGVDLSKDLLMKVAVFKVAPQSFKIVWTHHHIVIDGWCLGIIFNDFFSLYNSLSDGVNAQLNPVQPYSNYIDWIENQDKHKAANYWSQLLEDVEEVVHIPGKIKDPKPGFEQANTKWELNEAEFAELSRVANLHKVTPYTLLQTVWGILLQKYNSLDHVVFGSVVSGRPPEIDGVEQMVGLFINTVPVKIGRDTRFADTLKQVQQQSNLSGQFEYLPLGEITALSPLKNDLINHLMIYENYPLEKQTEKLQNAANQIKIEGVENNERTNYDFTLTILPSETLTVSFDFNTYAYQKEWIERIKTHFSAMLNYVLHNPSQEIAAIPLLSTEEENELLEKTSAKKRENQAKYVPQLFAEAVWKYAANTALIHRGERMSYAELDERSNQIATYLIHEIGIKTNDVVGIFAKPSFEMLAALFGILKSGAAYMPIDANYPPERIAYMVEDSGAKCLLFNTDLPEELDVKLPSIEISSAFNANESKSISVDIQSQDKAYIIYTSGSTGKPKGVVVTHENFVDYIQTIHEMFDISPQDMTLQHASIAFDTTIEELYPVLTAGGSLLLPNDNKDFEEIITNISQYPVTIFCTSPLVLNYLNETVTDYNSLRLITVGGDELKSNYVDKIIHHVAIWNGYGPTESTVCATYYQVTGTENAMPIGKPFTNRSSYLMNQDGNLLPYGLAGELCVGGKGVTDGYLNRTDLTEEKFVTNPFDEGKIYKTGDRCQWDENRNLLFYGRIDAQVKIRGFRIEIGEIETRLLEHSAVKEAVVLAWEDETNNGKFLAAYLTGDTSEQELRTFLEQELPEYMVPAYFVFLDKMPLTINGKTDRKALQRPDTEKMAEENFAAAENETQEILTKVWSEILNVKVGIDHNFFSLGGDSIKAIQMASRIQKYHLRIEVKDLFANPTIRQLTPFVKSTTLLINQELEIGEASLIPIQKAFLEERLVHPHQYNQSVILFAEKRLDVSLLQNAIKQIMTHHDALRMVLKENTLNYLSPDDFGVPLELIKESNREKAESHIQQTQQSFELEKGPLFKAVLYQMDDGDHLFLVAHHLVVDGISWRIILEDLQQLLKGNNELPLKTHSFGEWGKQLKIYANSEQLKQEMNYWQNVEAVAVNKPITENKYAENLRTSIELDEQQTENLLKHVNDAYNTEINDILLAALSATLESWDGNNQHVVFLEGHGREEIIEEVDINRTVGWFTAMYPIVLTNTSEVSHLIKQTKEYLRKIPNKGIGYGVLRYLNPSTEFNLTPQITFNYLGQFDDTFSNENMKLSPLSSGYDVSLENSKESILDVSGMIVNSKLKMDFMYNPNISDEAVINKLKEEFKINLLAIINHCLEKEDSEMTVSDFDSKDISEDELDDIMDMFDDL